MTASTAVGVEIRIASFPASSFIRRAPDRIVLLRDPHESSRSTRETNRLGPRPFTRVRNVSAARAKAHRVSFFNYLPESRPSCGGLIRALAVKPAWKRGL